MARIFRFEQGVINGNVKLTTGGTAGAFVIQTTAGSTLMSRESIDSDISSLAAVNTAFDASVLTDKNSNDAMDAAILAAKQADDGLDTNMGTAETSDGTVQAGILTEKNSDDAMDAAILSAKQADDGLDTNMATLDAANTVMNSDVSSLAAAISTNDVVAKSTSATNGASSQTISYGRTFNATPASMVSLRSSDSTDPIIPCFITASSTTQFTVSYGEEIPNTNYTVESYHSEVG